MNKNKLFVLAAASIAIVFAAIIFIPCPTDAQYVVFRIILSLGAGGIGAAIPGFLRITFKPQIMAGGGLGVFVFAYLFTPSLLDSTQKCHDPFALTVYVHGENGRNDLVLKGQGQVVLDLEGDRRIEKINETGEAFFPGIPPQFHEQPVQINILPEHGIVYTATDTNDIIIGKKKAINLKVTKTGLDNISGVVRDRNNLPVQEVTVTVHGIVSTTDAMGYFIMMIPKEKQQIQQKLTAYKKGYQVYEESVYPATKKEVEIVLK